MAADPLSGVEIELVLDATTRLELASVLADRLGATVEPETTVSKVPVPSFRGRVPDRDVPQATIAALQENARLHQARILKVAADGRHFYLEHRGARLVDADGLVCRLVHDNTLIGGERVCEIITAPLRRAELSRPVGSG